MFSGRIFHWLLLGVVLLVVASAGALTAANTVEESGADDNSRGVGAQDLAPPQCAGLNLNNIIVSDDLFIVGTDQNDLILAGPSAAWGIFGGDGNDCILSGDGDDGYGFFFGGINGGAGNDVCFRGPGSDTIGTGCEATPVFP